MKPGSEVTLHERVTMTRRKDFYDGTWWDENGEGAWFPIARWQAWEAVAGFAYYLSDGDLNLGVSVELVGSVYLAPAHLASPEEYGEEPDPDGRHFRVDHLIASGDISEDVCVEAWEVRPA